MGVLGSMHISGHVPQAQQSYLRLSCSPLVSQLAQNSNYPPGKLSRCAKTSYFEDED